MSKIKTKTTSSCSKPKQMIKVESTHESFCIGELIKGSIPKVNWVLEGMIPEGLTMVAGPPKSRKSFFCMQLAASVVSGKPFCEGGAMPGKKTNVYYFALDDPKRRVHSRFAPLSHQYDNDFKGLEGSMNWFDPGLDPIDELEKLFDKFTNTDLYIVDIYTKMKKKDGPKAKSVYEADYESLAPYKELCAKHGKSMIITHHMNKGYTESKDGTDKVSGSTGISAALDSLIMIELNRKAKKTNLNITSNDMEELNLPMNFNPEDLLWEVAKPELEKLTPTNKKIATKFARYKSFTYKDLVKEFKITEPTARSQLSRLRICPGLVIRAKDSEGNPIDNTYTIAPDNPYGIAKSPIVSLSDPSNASVINSIDLDSLTKPIESKPGNNGNKILLTSGGGSFARSNEIYIKNLKYSEGLDDNIKVSN